MHYIFGQKRFMRCISGNVVFLCVAWSSRVGVVEAAEEEVESTAKNHRVAADTTTDFHTRLVEAHVRRYGNAGLGVVLAACLRIQLGARVSLLCRWRARLPAFLRACCCVGLAYPELRNERLAFGVIGAEAATVEDAEVTCRGRG